MPTGIAYNGGGKLRIYKRPWPARFMRFRIPGDVRVIMGHTRLTTQGSEKRNYNNHPFEGRTREGAFALAHNGVLHNDRSLRKSQKLPYTRIETDSYVAVQLIEQKRPSTWTACNIWLKRWRALLISRCWMSGIPSISSRGIIPCAWSTSQRLVCTSMPPPRRSWERP